MTQNKAHTPTPWDICRLTIPNTPKSNYGLANEKGDCVAELKGEFTNQKANA